MLPKPADEDTFVTEWMDSDDLDGLCTAISAALDAHRPQLAARLVGLLDDSVEISPDSDLHRAQQAAQFLLVHPHSSAHTQALEQAWKEARRQRLRKRIKRMRDRAMGRPPRKR